MWVIIASSIWALCVFQLRNATHLRHSAQNKVLGIVCVLPRKAPVIETQGPQACVVRHQRIINLQNPVLHNLPIIMAAEAP